MVSAKICGAFALRQAGHQAGDLDRQFGAHILDLVIGQQCGW